MTKEQIEKKKNLNLVYTTEQASNQYTPKNETRNPETHHKPSIKPNLALLR